MTEQKQFDISADGDGLRLDKFLADHLPELSRTEVQRLIKAGEIQVNQSDCKASYKLEEGDSIRVTFPQAETLSVEAENIPLDTLYEDDDLVAINKPAGMVVHPAYGNRTGTVVNAALYHWPQMRRVTGEERAGIVHRLDKETSGVLVLAKTSSTLRHLQHQFKERTVYKKYYALVEGIPSSSTGMIDVPIGRSTDKRKQMAVKHDGRTAISHYTLIEDFNTHALLEIEPKTGRTHQIRVHLAWLGNPIVGDRIYGYRKQTIKMKRHFLHAGVLEVDSPTTGERLHFEAELPANLQNTLDKLRRNLR